MYNVKQVQQFRESIPREVEGRRQKIWISLILLLVLIRFLWVTLNAEIVLVNRTWLRLDKIQIEISGENFEARNIWPGESRIWLFSPSQDGGFKVTGRFSTGKPITSSVGYTTPGDTYRHHLIVRSDGSVEYSSRKKLL